MYWRGFYKQAQRFFVYRNVHKLKDRHVYSLKNKQTGRVDRHVDGEVYLTNPVFKVSEPGRQRVLSEGRKNVHAGIEGDIVDGTAPKNYVGADWRAITYDPRKHQTFIYRDTGKPVQAGDVSVVRLTPEGPQVWSFVSGFRKRAQVKIYANAFGKSPPPPKRVEIRVDPREYSEARGTEMFGR